MPKVRIAGLLLLCALCAILTSCGESPPDFKINKVPTVPVKGKVTVDGQPQAGIEIGCEAIGAFDHAGITPKTLHGTTNENGEFSLGTYDVSDGIPVGEYALTFTWPVLTLRRGESADTKQNDQFKGKYAKGSNSPLKIKVEADKPLNLEPVDLKTK